MTETLILKKNWYLESGAEDFDPESGAKREIPEGAREVSVPISSYDSAEGHTAMRLYRRFGKPEKKAGERTVLRLEATGYYCRVYVNGKNLGEYEDLDGVHEFDLTDALEDGNLLCLYLFMPNNEHRLRGLAFENVAATFNANRVGHEPYIYSRPEVYIEDVFVNPDIDTGNVDCTLTLVNGCAQTVHAVLESRLGPHKIQVISSRKSDGLNLPCGKTEYKVKLQAEEGYKLWSPDEPNLYDAFFSLRWEGHVSENMTVCGFKRLKVDDSGCFELNGKRIFLKCIHTAFYYPGAVDIDENYDAVYKELSYLKLCGFNAVRYIHDAAHRIQLDICDELGLMIYEEHQAGWLKLECPELEENFINSLKTVLRRDRNHASLCLFGVLNETWDKPPTSVQTSVAFRAPSFLRDISPNTLFMLSSGRFDGQSKYGSACNPGSYKWDGLFGNEHGDESIPQDHELGVAGSAEYGNYTGDVHTYPGVPYSVGVKEHLEKFTQGKRRSIITEVGLGSLVDVVQDHLLPQQYPERSRNKWQENYLKEHYEQLLKAFRDLRLDKVYGSPKALIEASEEMNSYQRKLEMTLIRRTGYSGVSLTMTTDGDASEEGVTNRWIKLKKGMPEQLAEGWADMRWCIFFDNVLLYRGEELNYDVVLSQFNVIQDKEYKGKITITGRVGTVYEKEFAFTPVRGEDGYFPFNIPVCKESVKADFPAGDYTFSIQMYADADPAAYSKDFSIVEKPSFAGRKVALVGLSDAFADNLRSLGAEIDDGADTVFVGDIEMETAEREKLYKAAEDGKHVAFLSLVPLSTGRNVSPFEIEFPMAKAHGSSYNDWLYLFYNTLHGTHATEGLHNLGMMEGEYYKEVYPRNYLCFDKIPDEIHVSALFTGRYGPESGLVAAVRFGSFYHGKGKITFSALELIKGAGRPCADIIMRNLLD